MTIYTLIFFDDDEVISDMEHFDAYPEALIRDLTDVRNKDNWSLYKGDINGGDTLCILSSTPEN